MARERNVVVASDEAYADFVWEGESVSALQSGTEGLVTFFSLSKRSNMTGYRVGWACGDERVVSALGRVKVNLDSGTPCFVQSAAAAALRDDAHVEEMRAEYRSNMESLCRGLEAAGLPGTRPAGALYIWQKGPDGMSSAEFCRRLLAPDVAVAALPGEALAPALEDGTSPGEGYVRFSLTALPERVKEAARRIGEHLELE
jgi:LL-diaminopimelate aminotransferase